MITLDHNTGDTLPITTQHCMHIMLYVLSHYIFCHIMFCHS